MKLDVLIVGGGPAGSSCALGLASSGLRVAVLDRAEFPRDKVCAGWVTPQVLHSLAVDPNDYAAKRILQPIRGFATCSMGQRAAFADRGAVVSYGIRRCEFDHYLLTRCGATLRLGEPLERIERSAGVWRVNGDIEAQLVVGAGGHFCPLARRLRPAGPEPLVAAQEIEFEIAATERDSCPVSGEFPELFFSRDLRGYGWVFRKGNFLNVGIGRQGRGGLTGERRAFLRMLRQSGRLPAHVPDDFRGHAYLLHGETRRPLAAEGALLIGDAAGLAYPRSGEGIRPAVESGLLAAERIRKLGPGSPALGAAYRSAIEARFGARERTPGRGLTGWLPRPLTERVAGLLFANPVFAGQLVVDRWFTHRFEEALAPPPGQ